MATSLMATLLGLGTGMQLEALPNAPWGCLDVLPRFTMMASFAGTSLSPSWTKVAPAALAVLILLVVSDAADCPCEFRRPELVAFFDATGGPMWHRPWNLTDTVCAWSGVECSDGDITKLNLTQNNLDGTLPSTLSNLTLLETFMTEDNKLYGTLPAAYAAWRNIEHFNVAFNSLSGTLPASLAAWGGTIRFVYLHGNRFNGSLPNSFDAWLNVVVFDVYNNSFRSTLPEDFASWTRIKKFIVSENKLQGTLPDAYAAWTSVDTVYVHSNALAGTLPASLGDWGAAIWFVRFYDNHFNGTLPSSYSKWHNVATFDVHGNNISGTLPEAYASWVNNLAIFSVGENQLTGTLPTAYASWAALESFKIFENAIEGTLPPEYDVWTQLRNANIHRNALSGTIPSAYAAWGRSMEQFICSENRFSGSLPPELGPSWTRVELFLASHNALSGTLPDTYGAWARIYRFDVSNNFIHGTLPTVYGPSWSRCVSIAMANNSIGGTLPSAWSQMASLVTLSIDNNSLIGTLPPEYGQMGQLGDLSLSNNGLSGTLPDAWGDALRLQLLSLQGNRRLYGTIPVSWQLYMFTEAGGFGIFAGCRTQLCGNAAQIVQHGLIPLGFACLPAYDSTAVLDPNFRTEIIRQLIEGADYSYELPCALTGSNSRTQGSPTMTTSPSIEVAAAHDLWPVFILAQRSSRVGAWVGVAAAIASPAIAPPMSAVAAIQTASGVLRLRRRCDAAASVADDLPPPSSESVDNPMQVQVPSLGANLAYAGGAVLGNALLVLGVSLVLHVSAAVLRPRIARAACNLQEGPDRRPLPSPPSGRSSSLHQYLCVVAACATRAALALLSEDRLPGTMVVPYALLLQPSTTAAIVLLATTDSATSVGSYALGVFGSVAWLTPLALWVTQLVRLVRSFEEDCRVVPAKPPRRRSSKNNNKAFAAAFQRGQRWLLRPLGVWVLPKPPAVTAATGVSTTTGSVTATRLTSYAPMFRSFRHGRYWFLALELGLVAASGVILGIAFVAEDSCAASLWAGWVLVGLSVAQLLVYVLLRPFLVRIDAVVSTSACVLAIAVEGSALLGALDAADSIALVQVALELGAIVVCAIGAVCDGGRIEGKAPQPSASLRSGAEMTQPLSVHTRHDSGRDRVATSLKVLVGLICTEQRRQASASYD